MLVDTVALVENDYGGTFAFHLRQSPRGRDAIAVFDHPWCYSRWASLPPSCLRVELQSIKSLAKFRQAYPRLRKRVKANQRALAAANPAPYITLMNLKDGSNVVANLTTIGRTTGQPRTVELRFLYYRGCFYATSSKVQGKHWCQNMLKNSQVDLAVKDEKFSCNARQVTDDNLRRQILDDARFAAAVGSGGLRDQAARRIILIGALFFGLLLLLGRFLLHTLDALLHALHH